MAVEKLLQPNKIHIKDIQVEVLEKKPEVGSEMLYRRLKDTPLYNNWTQQWIHYMNEEQVINKHETYTDTQLMGLFVEAQFDRESAMDKYEKLKSDPLNNFWEIFLNDEPLVDTAYMFYSTSDYLQRILIESEFDPERANKQHERLKCTPLFDNVTKQWNRNSILYSDDAPALAEHRLAITQLLGIFVEAQFDEQAAKERYDGIKQTDIYDNTRKHWYDSIYKTQNRTDVTSDVTAQLLGVLVEGVFNKETARQQLKDLKNSPLYDSERQQWNYSVFEDLEYQDTSRYAYDQLLGVLAENMLEEHVFQASDEQLPKMRRF